MKTIILTIVVGLVLISFLSTKAYAEGGAYDRGYSVGSCDAVSCHNHGYDAKCPGEHSNDYCVNYDNGYNAGWDAANGQQNSPPPPFTQTDQSNSQGAAINGNDNTLNQQASNDNSNQLPQCEVNCSVNNR